MDINTEIISNNNKNKCFIIVRSSVLDPNNLGSTSAPPPHPSFYQNLFLLSLGTQLPLKYWSVSMPWGDLNEYKLSLIPHSRGENIISIVYVTSDLTEHQSIFTRCPSLSQSLVQQGFPSLPVTYPHEVQINGGRLTTPIPATFPSCRFPQLIQPAAWQLFHFLII